MELWDELLLSWITILFAVLIAKIASAAADLGRDPSKNGGDRSVELEDLGRRRERSEQVQAVGAISGEVLGSQPIGSSGAEKDDGKRSQVNDATIEEEKRYEEVDVVVEQSVREVDQTVKFDQQDEEHREEKRFQAVDLVIEESVRELEETVEFVLREEENREERRSQVLDLVIDESVKELGEPVKIDEDDDEIVQEREQFPEMRSSIHEEGCNKSSFSVKEGSLLYGEDEWEGIEKSELEKLFGVAMEYIGSEDGGDALSRLSSDVQKQLHGLHKVATEGPCYEPQPLALKVTARAKWHSWQSLGKMNPEVAMEQYIALLSESIPGWMGESGVDAKQGKGDDTLDVGASRTEAPDLSSFLDVQPTSYGAQRTFEDPSSVEVDKPTNGTKLFEKGLTQTFLFNLLSPARVTFLTFYW